MDSESVNIEAFRINAGNHWELEEYTSVNSMLLIPEVAVQIELAGIYEGARLTY